MEELNMRNYLLKYKLIKLRYPDKVIRLVILERQTDKQTDRQAGKTVKQR